MTTTQEIESMVIRKTNKYVYFNNGTHMTYKDFHLYKEGLRKDMQLVIAADIKNSTKMIFQSLKEKEKLEELLEELYNKNTNLSMQIDSLERDERDEAADWEDLYRKQIDKTESVKNKLNNHATKLYKDLKSLPILKNYTNDKGIKFIIQRNYKTNEHRFCFDPYELGDNFHSQLSEFFKDENWGTINGGWMKVIYDAVILYAQSGDYGVYNDDIATDCARVLFSDKLIFSFAGKEWKYVGYLYSKV